MNKATAIQMRRQEYPYSRFRNRRGSDPYVSHAKAPKLRFAPGNFFRKESGKDKGLWCCVFVYRTENEPNVWVYVLEERTNLKRPDTMLSVACEMLAGRVESNERVLYRPLKSGEDYHDFVHRTDYVHGDRINVVASRLYREFTHISSGEVETSD